MHTSNIADTKHVLVTQIGLDQISADLWLWIWLIWSEKGHKGPWIDQNQPVVITLNYTCESVAHITFCRPRSFVLQGDSFHLSSIMHEQREM